MNKQDRDYKIMTLDTQVQEASRRATITFTTEIEAILVGLLSRGTPIADIGIQVHPAKTVITVRDVPRYEFSVSLVVLPRGSAE